MNEYIFYLLYGTIRHAAWYDAAVLYSAEYAPFVMVGAVLCFALAAIAAEEGWYAASTSAHERWISVARHAVLALLIALLGWGIALFIKTVVATPRPFEVLPDIAPLFTPHDAGAFPSAHAAFMFALAGGVAVFAPRWSLLFFIVAAATALARVAAGVHWPLDVLAGALIGTLTAWWCVHRARSARP